MTIGAHVSSAGGLINIFDNADKIGAQAIQSFASPPSNWNFKMPDKEQIKAYLERRAQGNYGPITFHGIYLMNFASENPLLIEKSITSLSNYLNLSAKLEMDGVIFHTGSTKDVPFEQRINDIIKNLSTVLEQTNSKSRMLFENSAGAGGTVGKKITEFEGIWDGLSKYRDRLGFCFDTCHAFASGYDVRTQDGLETLKRDLDNSIGKENVRALHVNDSKGPLGENKDRHENIGEGQIGLAGFKLLAHDEFFGSLPWILEVPGFENSGPDKKNLDIVRAL